MTSPLHDLRARAGSVLDLRRLLGVLVTLSSVALVFGACGALLASTIGRDTRRLLGSDWTSYTLMSYEQAGKTISGVLKEGRPIDGRLGVLLGASTQHWGVDPVKLGPRQTLPWRWLSLNGVGATATDLDGMFGMLAENGIRPGVLVLSLNLGMMARSADFLADPESEDATGPWNRLLPARTRVKKRLYYLTLMARMALFDSLGLGAGATFPAAQNPWVVDVSWMPQAHASADYIETQLAGLRNRGWFDPSAYTVDSQDMKAIVRTIARARAQRTRVVIVLMPESRRIRDLVPPGARRRLDEALGGAFATEAPTVVDLRDSMPERVFHDATHLDLEGREIFTQRLSRELESRLGAKRSPLRTGSPDLPAD